jgi:hypothetical protein
MVASRCSTTRALSLPTLALQKAEALQLPGELLKERHGGELFWNGTPWRLEVTDGPNPGGRTFFVMHFSVTDGPIVADPRALRMTSWTDENIPAASRALPVSTMGLALDMPKLLTHHLDETSSPVSLSIGLQIWL